MRTRRTENVLSRIRASVLARAVLVVDDLGEAVAFEGEPDINTSHLGELAIARLGEIDGVLRQVGQLDAGVLVHHVPGGDVYVAAVSEERILAVLFDQAKTSLGVVRREVQAHRNELVRAVQPEA
jgi:hypothetical protein